MYITGGGWSVSHLAVTGAACTYVRTCPSSLPLPLQHQSSSSQARRDVRNILLHSLAPGSSTNLNQRAHITLRNILPVLAPPTTVRSGHLPEFRDVDG